MNPNPIPQPASDATPIRLQACHCCGLIQTVPVAGPDQVAACARCDSRFRPPTQHLRSASRTAAAALASLILFWPAVLLPIVEIEQLGLRNRTSVISGIVELFRHGDLFVGSVVFLFSIVFPLTKIVLLFELSCLELLHWRHKAITLRLMEHLGKWSMMDVMLLALFVMLVKLGNLVEFHFGPAIVAFVLCVATSMLASLSFDPHGIWDQVEIKPASIRPQSPETIAAGTTVESGKP